MDSALLLLLDRRAGGGAEVEGLLKCCDVVAEERRRRSGGCSLLGSGRRGVSCFQGWRSKRAGLHGYRLRPSRKNGITE